MSLQEQKQEFGSPVAEEYFRPRFYCQLAGVDLVSRPIALLVLLFSLQLNHSSPLRAGEVVLADSEVGLASMKSVIAKAVEKGLWITELDVSVQGNRVVFDYALAENIDDTPWFVRLNATDAMLLKAEQAFADQDYSRFIEASSQVNGQAVSSVVWRKISLPTPLILPIGELPESGKFQESSRGIDEVANRFLKQHNAVGVTIAIGASGRLVYSRGFGYGDLDNVRAMQPDAELRIASLSKTITAATVLQLVEEGRLAFENRLLPFLREAGFEIPRGIDERWGKVTVRHLIEHSGGWDRQKSGDPMFKAGMVTRVQKLRQPATSRDIIEYQLSRSLDFEPGVRDAYSNFGYVLLGQVIEAVTGQEYEAAVRELMLRPVGMASTYIGRTRLRNRGVSEANYYMQNTQTFRPFWSFSDRSNRKLVPLVAAPDGRWSLKEMASAAGWVSTAPELVRLAFAIESRQANVDRDLIEKMMTENNQDVGELPASVDVCQFGSLEGTSAMLFRRSDGIVCCVLFNTDHSVHGGSLAEEFLPLICDAIAQVRKWPSGDLFVRKPKVAVSD